MHVWRKSSVNCLIFGLIFKINQSCCISFCSSQNVLSKVFWVQFDSTKRLTAITLIPTTNKIADFYLFPPQNRRGISPRTVYRSWTADRASWSALHAPLCPFHRQWPILWRPRWPSLQFLHFLHKNFFKIDQSIDRTLKALNFRFWMQ